MEKIGFFDGTEFAFLSNFFVAPIIYKGKEYKTNEHLFQAMKASTEEEHEKIRLVPNPGSAKRLGRQCNLRSDWEEIKDNVMLHACICKFFQHADLAEKLLATKNIYLEEGNTWNDRYWGVVNGEGKNMLGKTLMKVRTLLNLHEENK